MNEKLSKWISFRIEGSQFKHKYLNTSSIENLCKSASTQGCDSG